MPFNPLIVSPFDSDRTHAVASSAPEPVFSSSGTIRGNTIFTGNGTITAVSGSVNVNDGRVITHVSSGSGQFDWINPSTWLNSVGLPQPIETEDRTAGQVVANASVQADTLALTVNRLVDNIGNALRNTVANSYVFDPVRGTVSIDTNDQDRADRVVRCTLTVPVPVEVIQCTLNVPADRSEEVFEFEEV